MTALYFTSDTRFARITATLLAALSFALGTSAARATGFEFSPVRLSLTTKDHVSSVAVKNPADAPLRIEVRSLRLTQDAAGRTTLTPSDDLLVFPQLATIPPHAVRNLRVAATGALGEREGAYMVQITEISAFSAPATRQTAIALEMQAQIPVFVAPSIQRRSAAISDEGVRDRSVSFTVRSAGTVHFVTKNVRITGAGAGARTLFAADLPGGIVLADGRQDFRFPLTSAQCAGLRAVTIGLEADDQKLVRTLDVGADACK
jgi:P pilus assembly chaperone PapD